MKELKCVGPIGPTSSTKKILITVITHLAGYPTSQMFSPSSSSFHHLNLQKKTPKLISLLFLCVPSRSSLSRQRPNTLPGSRPLVQHTPLVNTKLTHYLTQPLRLKTSKPCAFFLYPNFSVWNWSTNVINIFFGITFRFLVFSPFAPPITFLVALLISPLTILLC